MADLDGPEVIILDACCLINLAATRRFRDILSTLPVRFAVAAYVRDHEALYVLADETTGERELIDLTPLATKGLIEIEDLETDQETLLFVELAAQIEDGEAATCALALHHGFTVATDERKVLNLIRTKFPTLGVRTTVELIRWWIEEGHVADEAIAGILQGIESRARFKPSKRDPLFDWWNRIIGR